MNTEIMKSEVAGELEPIQNPTPMSMLQMAVAQGADLDKLTKLMELQERFEANEARKAFSVAFSDFKAEAMTILRNVTVKDGPLANKKYADLHGVVSVVTPVLSKHGLSHSWKLTKDDKDWMEVTCTIKHILGHSEAVSMGAAPDTGPGRNAIQARMSAVSYLERYTLLAATGTAAAGMDDDGKQPGAGKQMEQSEFQRLSELIETAQTVDSLSSKYLAACNDAKEIGDQKAIANFAIIKNKRYRELVPKVGAK